jgi:hypothetical protein
MVTLTSPDAGQMEYRHDLAATLNEKQTGVLPMRTFTHALIGNNLREVRPRLRVSMVRAFTPLRRPTSSDRCLARYS